MMMALTKKTDILKAAPFLQNLIDAILTRGKGKVNKKIQKNTVAFYPINRCINGRFMHSFHENMKIIQTGPAA